MWAQAFEACGGLLAGSYQEVKACSIDDWDRWMAWRNAKAEGEIKRGNE